jgi:amino acid transporter
MALDQGVAQPTAEEPTLRRTLKIWQVIGLSVGLMAPSMAISINPQGAIGAVGRAIPLSFVISMVGALLVAYGFARLSQYFHGSGSVIGLVGATIGARAGMVAGWALAGCYTVFVLLVAVTGGIFAGILLNTWGVLHGSPAWFVFLVATVLLLLTAVVAVIPAAKVTDTILTFEGVTVGLILIAAIVVLAKLFSHTGPGNLHFTLSVFTPAKGTSTSDIFLGVVFGFLSFAGFEGAAALGGEAAKPRRDIPRAIIASTAVVGLFYVVISAVEVMGFGTSKTGLNNFYNSESLMGGLGQAYVSSWFGDLITIGTLVSAFGCCLASCVGASRLVFSFARDAIGPRSPVARVSSRWGTPITAVAVVMVANFVMLIALGGLAGSSPRSIFDWTGTIGTYLILFAYLLVSVGAINYLFLQPRLKRQPLKAPRFELTFPALGVIVILYTYYRNIHPYPTGSAAWLPVVAGIWLLIAVVAVIVAPAFSRRLGEKLILDEGVESDLVVVVDESSQTEQSPVS